ncbi:MAG TPA: SRPBCC family protein [Anaerolineales bacterium]|nr:SRPBCC family protein [Anaerolineales bacterium]
MGIISPMKQGSFEKEIHIQADAATVVHLIADYSQHHKIHPLIEKVERAQDEPTGVRRYFITDHLQWGPFKFKIKYRADILAVTEDTVHTEAYQSPQTFITNLTKVIPEGDGVCLHETITLRAPVLLFGYAFQQAQVAHEEMLKRIKSFVENSKS